MTGRGFVYLVGAGPGDPRLLTVRAHELVRAAEVVAYDELVSPAILALAPPDAERVAVGRRAGHGPTAFRLHPAVLDRARAGRHVVRLKCGDPLVFGRGGEEAEELAAAGIGFEIVPGVSAALGAAACAGIPLTHRACASSVRLATGQTAEPIAGAPRGETIVVYMAARRVAASLSELTAAGWSPATPAAWIAAATTPAQQVVTGTIGDLAARLADHAAALAAPALLVVGDVVARRTPWWEDRPLIGRRVLVARARPGRSRLAARLRALGAEVIEAPAIDVTAIGDDALDAALDGVGDAVLAFGCAPGVDAVLARRAVAPARILAIGGAAARALARRGVVPGLAVTGGACRDALAPAVAALGARPVVVVTATSGRPSLLDELAALGVRAEPLPAYRAAPRPTPTPGRFDVLALPSSSAARLVLAADPRLRDVPAIAMGPRTEAAARALGASRVRRAGADTVDAMVAGVVAVTREVA